jgi:IS30 family transposase
MKKNTIFNAFVNVSGLSNKEIAKLLNINESTLSRKINGVQNYDIQDKELAIMVKNYEEQQNMLKAFKKQLNLPDFLSVKPQERLPLSQAIIDIFLNENS